MSQQPDSIKQAREEIEFLKTRLRAVARKPLLTDARESEGYVVPMLRTAKQAVQANPVLVGVVAASLLAAFGPARVARLGLWAALIAARTTAMRLSRPR